MRPNESPSAATVPGKMPSSNTNVYRLYNSLLVTSDQMTFYDDGVGADATGLDRLIQGAFALGFNQKILDAYTSIAHVYEPGDQIYLFGFSRGAYTVRSLGGMIASCGLPHRRPLRITASPRPLTPTAAPPHAPPSSPTSPPARPTHPRASPSPPSPWLACGTP